MAHTQAPGFFRTMLGEFEITALSDGTHPLPVASVMTDISQQQALQDLADADLTLPVQGSINAFLINTGSKLILVDTGAVAPYQTDGRYQPYAAFGPLEPDIAALPAPGHTPGLAAYLVQSRSQQLLIWGDVVHVAPIQLPHPGATVKYDSSAPNAQATRAQLLQQASEQHWIIAAAHIAFPGLGHIRQRHGEYQWLPLNYDESAASHP